MQRVSFETLCLVDVKEAAQAKLGHALNTPGGDLVSDELSSAASG